MNYRLSPLRSFDFLWLSITLFPLIALSFLFAIQPQDYWWLMRVGQETLQNGAIPLTDTISWSQAGQPIVYQQWLSGVLLFLTYRSGGVVSVLLLRGFLIAITYAVIWFMAREASTSQLASALVFILGIATALVHERLTKRE